MLLAALEQCESSGSRLRRKLGQEVDLAAVVYHLRVLEEAGCLETVESNPEGGVAETIYRAKRDVFLDPAYRAHVGAIENEETLVLHWSRVKVDDVGWDQLVDLLRAVRVQFEAIEEQSVLRLGVTGGSGTTTLTVGVAAVKPPSKKAKGS
jgi:hypothetical protein